MKNLTTFLLTIFTAISTYGQWSPTGISTNTIEAIYDVVSHDGILFASANTDGLIKSTDNGATWNVVGQTGFSTNPTSRHITHLRSTGTELYAVTFYANSASSMIYKSTDNGQTFVTDIDGMPVNSGEIVDVDYFYIHNNYAVAVVNSGNYIKSTSATTWQKNNSTSTQFSEHFAFYGNAFYAWGSYHLNKSTDNGQTWTASVDANLPPFFLANRLAVNPDSGRIYVSGRSLFNYDHKLLYSDNEGASWVDLNIGPHLGNNWIGVGQTIQSIFSKGNYIQLSLDNDAANSVPDVLVSIDGGATFSTDTVGLPSNAGNTTKAIAFALHNNNLFMALNFIDIYTKDVSTLEVAEFSDNLNMNVYPNPSNGDFYLNSTVKIKEIYVYNINGQLVKSIKDISGIQQISLKQKGLFCLKIIDDNEGVTIKKIICN